MLLAPGAMIPSYAPVPTGIPGAKKGKGKKEKEKVGKKDEGGGRGK